MATQNRSAEPDLIKTLLAQGNRFSFFQALYLLEQYTGVAGQAEDRSKIDLKSLRLVPSLSMGFAPSDILKITREGDKQFVVETALLGLYGSYSPLPAFYTEDILWNDRAGTSVKAFLDLFHHRLLSLFFKCWTKYRFHIKFEPESPDRFPACSLAGLNLPDPEMKTLSPVRMLRFSALLSQRPKSSSTLKKVLSSFFPDCVIKIKELVGKWAEIISDQRNALGKTNSRPGLDLSIGQRVFFRTGNFRVMVCPAGFRGFLRLLPGADDYVRLLEITRLFSPSDLQFDIELKLPPEGAPRIPLSSGKGIRLGFTCWLGNRSGEQSIIFSTT